MLGLLDWSCLLGLSHFELSGVEALLTYLLTSRGPILSICLVLSIAQSEADKQQLPIALVARATPAAVVVVAGGVAADFT